MSLQPNVSLQHCAVELQPGIWYVVTKGSNCGTFISGDKIRLLDDGCILCDHQGWIESEDVFDAVKGMEVQVDKQSLAKRREELERELRTLYEAKYNEC